MNEKFCSKCGTQNPADMIFCLNCGNSLTASAGASGYDNQSAPTVFAPTKVTQPTNFQPLAPQMPPLQPKKSNTGFYLAVFGGIGLILVLLFGGVVGLVALNWDKIAGEDDDPPRPVNVNISNPSSNTPSNPINSNVAVRPNNPNTLSSNPVVAHEPNRNASPTAPRATFNRIWVDYNITENGQKGMRIHTDFSVTNMKNLDSYLAIYFETRDGRRLRDINQKLYSTDGTVAIYRLLKPGYDVTDYKDLDVFMPYEELDLDQGKYDLRMDVDVIYKAGGLIQHLTYYNFEYTEPVKR